MVNRPVEPETKGIPPSRSFVGRPGYSADRAGLVTLMVRVPKNVDSQLPAIQVVVPTLHLALGALILATSLRSR